ncbi:hypothetical protein E8E13_004952 [Curvularia kusanoi]|uniref:Rhodopsin domain-containing protein n=1 Tax=Curvularia kusanoi TaxID=90978 RepID=A0A9P4TJ06_CURKU|nr:hypothetical protein E8E13_004952 [Curvularia kusanoi]
MSTLIGVFLVGALVLWQKAFSLGCSGPEPNSCNFLAPSGKALKWTFVASIVCDVVMHFVVRAAFFIFYLQLSAGARFRFWIGMGFGLDGMLLIFNTSITVFRCKPITASSRPLERITAQCMDSRIALFAPVTLNSLLSFYVLVLPMPIFYAIQLPLRRKIHICCVSAVGGVAVLMDFIHIHAVRALNTGTNTSRAIGETMIVGALGLSLAAIAYNLPSMRILWIHVMGSYSEPKNASQRSCNAESGYSLQGDTTKRSSGAIRKTVSISTTVQSAALVTNGIGRPMSASPDGTYWPRYPIINDDFGSRPRTPPSIV